MVYEEVYCGFIVVFFVFVEGIYIKGGYYYLFRVVFCYDFSNFVGGVFVFQFNVYKCIFWNGFKDFFKCWDFFILFNVCFFEFFEGYVFLFVFYVVCFVYGFVVYYYYVFVFCKLDVQFYVVCICFNCFFEGKESVFRVVVYVFFVFEDDNFIMFLYNNCFVFNMYCL